MWNREIGEVKPSIDRAYRRQATEDSVRVTCIVAKLGCYLPGVLVDTEVVDDISLWNNAKMFYLDSVSTEKAGR